LSTVDERVVRKVDEIIEKIQAAKPRTAVYSVSCKAIRLRKSCYQIKNTQQSTDRFFDLLVSSQ